MNTYNITLPMDMLWQEEDPDDYYADATEEEFISELHHNLYNAGFENIDISWSTVTTTKIIVYNNNGDEQPEGDDYHIIKNIIDNTDIVYISKED